MAARATSFAPTLSTWAKLFWRNTGAGDWGLGAGESATPLFPAPSPQSPVPLTPRLFCTGTYLNEEELCLELNRALVFSEDAAKLLCRAVRRFLVLSLLPDNARKNPRYFQPFLPQDEHGKAKKDQTLYEKENGYKAAAQKPNPIDVKVASSGAELGYWPRLENEFRQLLTALASAPNDAQLQQLLTATLLQSETPATGSVGKWLTQRSSWAEAVGKAARHSFLEIVGSRGKTARTLRATALAENWFNAEFNRRKNTYLKGKGAKPEISGTDGKTTDERSKA
ncbi:MAG: hypothetical protein ACREEM_11990 [Blastocatellia bacterium]